MSTSPLAAEAPKPPPKASLSSTLGEKKTRRVRAPLDRADWIVAATDVLAQEGVSGLSVERLAKRLKVTKGSFYWHFRDRKDLLMAVLHAWKEGRLRDILKQTQSMPGQEIEQIYRVIEVYSASRSRRGMLIELAVRDWARRDTDAACIVAEVDEVRLDRARALFLACGMPTEEASSRCTLLYAYVFGFSLMICDRFDADSTRIRKDIADLIAGPMKAIPPSPPEQDDGKGGECNIINEESI